MTTKEGIFWMSATLLVLLPRVVRAEEALTADSAVKLALEQNPELTSLSAEVQAADARLGGASLLFQANPEISGSVGSRSTATGNLLEYEAGVSQQLEVFGQRRSRIDGASAGRSSAEARLKARRSGLAAEVRQVFARALATEQLVEVAQENLGLARQTAKAAEKRLEVGDGSRIEVNTARVDVGRAARELNLALKNRATAHAELRLLLAVEPTMVLRLEGDLKSSAVIALVDPDALVRRALQSRWELSAARQGVEVARAEQRSAGREWLPRPRVGARYERDEGDQVVLGTLEFDLPVFNQNQAGRGVATAQLVQAELALQTTERRVRQEVLLAAVRLQAAQDAAKGFEGEVVEAMEENLRLVGTAYQAGKIDLFELLLIRRNTLETRRGYIEALEEQRAAEAELAKALGADGGRP